MLSLKHQRRLGNITKTTFEVAIIVFIAWALARIMWLLMAGPYAVSVASGIKTPRFATTVINPVSGGGNTSLLLENNYFRPIGARDNVSEIPETRLNLKLKGVRAGGASTQPVAIIRTPDNKDKSYTVGDEIVNGVTLSDVLNDRVFLSKNGTREVLVMEGASTILFQRAEPETETPVDTSDIPPESDTIMLPAKAATAIRFDTTSEAGALFILPRDAEKDDLSAYKLQAGDKVISINNTPADQLKPQDFFAAFLSNEVFAVEIERDGQRRKLNMRRKKEN